MLWVGAKFHRTHKNKPLDFEFYRYLKALYLDDSDYLIVKKSTQCGVSEFLMTTSFARAISGRSIFYVLPTFLLAGRFIRNRVDRTINFSRYYKHVIKSGLYKQSEAMLLKHMGQGSIAFVGSNTPSVFGEYPADDLIVDELDYCNQGNLAMGEERLSASEDKRQIKVSNPTVEGFGIDEEFGTTTQNEWMIKCDCGKWIRPDFFKHVVREVDGGQFVIRDEEYKRDGNDIHMICECGKPLDRKSEGTWVSDYQGRSKVGYHISKLFSTHVTIKEIVDRFEAGMVNDTKMQRFYNADLGVAYTATGAKISEQMLDGCKEDYMMKTPEEGVCVIGIDVGNVLTVRISQLLPDKRMKAVYIGEVFDYQEVVDLYRKYKVRVGTIDALPETRLSKKLVGALKGLFLVYYGNVKKDLIDIHSKILTVDRTSTLDNVKEAILLKNLILPKNARSIPNYYDQMTASTRTYDEVKQRYVWVETSKADHFFHAESYGILARKLLTMLAR